MNINKINDAIGNEVNGVREYNPDKWMVFKMNEEVDKDYRVLAGWIGGFADADYWKINSGIKSVEKDGKKFVINGFSGSKYTVHEDNYGYTMLSSGVMNSLMVKYPDIRKLSLEDFLVEW